MRWYLQRFWKRFDSSNNGFDRPLTKGEKKKVISVRKDELGEKIMKEFIGLRPNSYDYLIDDCSEDKNAKDAETCVMNRKLKLEDYQNCLEATKLRLK